MALTVTPMRRNFHLNNRREQKSCPTPFFNNHAVENLFAFNGDSKRDLHNITTGSIVTEEMKEDISNIKVR